ncbi:MAG: DUF1501 domain-containing protein, partial [Saprospiraceae bacterium]|nr:DUF1501 domain-containing protein [Saprospiraceae bacterium]
MDQRQLENSLSGSRRDFLARSTLGLGSIALSNLINTGLFASNSGHPSETGGQAPSAKVRRVVYLFQSGGPSQLDLFDYKPLLTELHGQDLPESIRAGQRLTGMSGNQTTFPLTASKYAFAKYGESQRWVSELMPHTARVVDDLCFINSVYTEAINHDPAITFLQTGNMLPGRPSIGSWVSYGLGSDNEDLPAFIVLVSKNAGGQPLYARLWGNGFLPTEHQGVQFRSGKDPVLFLKNPEGYEAGDREAMLSYLKQLNDVQYGTYGDPEINARMAQYEMAFRMQTSVPGVMDMSNEPDHIYDLYGSDSRDPGTYAANCLLARKLLEKDVKFVQLYHQGWDQHLNLPAGISNQCRKTDQATAALVIDLKQRGLLEDTLIIWGGEFGRTAYSQG